MNNATDLDTATARFDLLVNAPALFNAMVTAVELDVFRFLADHPGAGFADIQAYTGIPAHQLRVLLHAVCTTGLITKDGPRYANSPLANDLLAHDGPDSWRHILVGWRDIYYPAFARLTSAIRTGTNTALDDLPGSGATLYQRLSGNPELEGVLHTAMSAFTLCSVSGLADRPEIAGARHLLDLGGGDGTTALWLARRYPHLRVTVFDLDTVTELTEPGALARFDGRVRARPGDLFADPFPADVDAVLFSHVLEVFPAADILTLLAKAFDVLPAGGRLLVYGFNASDDETAGLYSARLSLYLNVLATGGGMAYPAKDYEGWLVEVGCVDVATVTGLPYEHGLTIGTKP